MKMKRIKETQRLNRKLVFTKMKVQLMLHNLITLMKINYQEDFKLNKTTWTLIQELKLLALKVLKN
jgi:hypothetical protein